MPAILLILQSRDTLLFLRFVFQKENYLCTPVFGMVLTNYADVVKLVDTLDLGSSALRCVGSSPSIRT